MGGEQQEGKPLTTREQIEKEVDEYIARIETDFKHDSSFGDRVADGIASFGGSWKFIWIMIGFLAIWVTINSLAILSGIHWDEPPFILLNLVLSFLAGFQAPIIMMSQNRQSAKDRYYASMQFRNSYINYRQTQELHELIDSLKQMGTDEKTELSKLEEIENQVKQLMKGNNQ